MDDNGPRFSDGAVAYIEESVARSDDVPFRLRLLPAMCIGSGEEEITYEGPHLGIYGRAGTDGSATLVDPVPVPVGGCTVLMSRSDFDRTRGVFIDLLGLSSRSGNARTYILALI